MDRRAICELYRQIREGVDIPAPRKLLNRVKPDDAARRLPGMPYSLLTNLAHTVFWQRQWLCALRGEKRASITEDWVEPKASEWEPLRQEYLANLAEAEAYANADPFKHEDKSDEKAVSRLIQLAIHDSYHLGQMNLLKRSLRASKS